MIRTLEETWPHLITCKQSSERQLDRTQMSDEQRRKSSLELEHDDALAN
jgi:hypothetical protein